MLHADIAKMINEQINKELFSAYLYLDFSNQLNQKGLDGFANWYEVQAQEELDHAMLFYQYMHNNSQQVNLMAIDQPNQKFDDVLGILKEALAHEEYITQSINDIYAAVQEKKDFRTVQFLDWFVAEQGEEETNANDLITKMELFGSDVKGLYMLNNELKSRVHTPPSLQL